MNNRLSREFERWNVDSDYLETEDYKLNNKLALEISKKVTKRYRSLSRILALMRLKVCSSSQSKFTAL